MSHYHPIPGEKLAELIEKWNRTGFIYCAAQLESLLIPIESSVLVPSVPEAAGVDVESAIRNATEEMAATKVGSNETWDSIIRRHIVPAISTELAAARVAAFNDAADFINSIDPMKPAFVDSYIASQVRALAGPTTTERKAEEGG